MTDETPIDDLTAKEIGELLTQNGGQIRRKQRQDQACSYRLGDERTILFSAKRRRTMLLLSPKACDVYESAQHRLQKHFLTEVSCEWRDGIPYLRGHTHSSCQKQLAQEAIRSLDGIEAVVNEIEVDS